MANTIDPEFLRLDKHRFIKDDPSFSTKGGGFHKMLNAWELKYLHKKYDTVNPEKKND